MKILSIRLPPLLISSPTTISDEALIVSLDTVDDWSCSKAPLPVPTVIGSILWEADSEMQFTVHGFY